MQANAVDPALAGVPKKPPKAVFKYVMNPLVRFLLRTPFGANKIGGVLMELRYTGRKSGKQVAIPVGYQQVGEQITVFTHSPWWQNFVHGAQVQMLVRGQRLRGWATSTRDVDEVFPPFRAWLHRDGPRAGRPFDITFEEGNPPSDEYLKQAVAGQKLAMVRIDPTDPRAR